MFTDVLDPVLHNALCNTIKDSGTSDSNITPASAPCLPPFVRATRRGTSQLAGAVPLVFVLIVMDWRAPKSSRVTLPNTSKHDCWEKVCNAST